MIKKQDELFKDLKKPNFSQRLQGESATTCAIRPSTHWVKNVRKVFSFVGKMAVARCTGRAAMDSWKCLVSWSMLAWAMSMIELRMAPLCWCWHVAWLVVGMIADKVWACIPHYIPLSLSTTSIPLLPSLNWIWSILWFHVCSSTTAKPTAKPFLIPGFEHQPEKKKTGFVGLVAFRGLVRFWWPYPCGRWLVVLARRFDGTQ